MGLRHRLVRVVHKVLGLLFLPLHLLVEVGVVRFHLPPQVQVVLVGVGHLKIHRDLQVELATLHP